MDDTISKKAVLVAVKDALMAWSYMPEWRDEKILKAIAELPSAQPTFDARDTQYNLPIGTDLISRQQAIDALWKALFEYEEETEKQFQKRDDLDVGDWIGEYREFVQNMSDIDRRVILNMPPAEPKGGKWILDRSGAYCCSECMEPCAGYVMMKPRDKFCKMCGAKMEETT